jgi:hypothetical protein
VAAWAKSTFVKSGGEDHRTALKTFQKRFFLGPESREAFEREARIWARLTGLPFILPVVAFFWDDGRPFIQTIAIEPPSGRH